MHTGKGTIGMKWDEFLSWSKRIAEIASGSVTESASEIWLEWQRKLGVEQKAKAEAKRKNKTVAVSIEDLGLGEAPKLVEHGLKRI